MKALSTFLLLLLFLLESNQCNATHAMGADIAWECLGNDKYKVTTTAYRDCGGIGMSNTRMRFTGNCSGITTTSQSMSSGKDITPVCNGQCTDCSSRFCNFQYGIQQYELTTTIDVSGFKKNGCCEVTIWWSEGGRSNTITTGAANESLYVEGKMNVCQSSCDNSPVFNSVPISIICLGKEVNMNAGASDKDSVNGKKDSLVHTITDPLAGGGGKTSWNGLYSSQRPLNYLGFPKSYTVDKFPNGFHLDIATGQLQFVPKKIERTVFAIKVEEYRNGKKIGEITRDAQIVVIKCPNNNPPVLSGANCSAPKPINFNIYACIGKPICIDICISDKDKTDTTILSCEHSIPNATYSATGAKKNVLRFCWTPKLSHVRSEPYSFRVKATDSACPIPGMAERVYSIYVGDSTPFQIYTTLEPIKPKCGEFWLKARTTDNVPNHEWNWYLNDSVLIHRSTKRTSRDSFKYKFDSNGIYGIKIRSNRSACFETFKRSINMTVLKPLQLPHLNDTSLCKEKRLYTRISAKGGHGQLKYFWTINDGTFSAQSDSIDFTLPQPAAGSTYLKRIDYMVTDSAGCTANDNFKILVKRQESLSLMDDTILCGGDLDTLLPTKGIQGTWNGNGVNNGRFSSKGLPRKLHVLEFYAENSKSCITDTVSIGTYNLPVVNAGVDTTVCQNSMDLVLSPQPKTGKWKGSYLETRNYETYFKSSLAPTDTIYSLIFDGYDSVGCENSDTLEIAVRNNPIVDAGEDLEHCFNGSQDSIKLNGKPIRGIWSGDAQADAHQFLHISQQHVGQSTYHYRFTNTYGCSSVDSMVLIVKPLPTVWAGKDDTICLSKDTYYNLKGSPNNGVWNGPEIKNSPSSSRILLHNALLGQQTYTFSLTDQFGCSNADGLHIYIGTKNDALFTPSSNLGKAPLTVTFKNESVNANSYLWNFGNGNSSTDFEPTTTYSSEGKYAVSLTTIDGTGFCSSTHFDTIVVNGNVSVNNLPNQAIDMYPNPTNGFLKLKSSMGRELRVDVLNASGSLVSSAQMNEQITLNLKALPAGLYLMKITDATGLAWTSKLQVE